MDQGQLAPSLSQATGEQLTNPMRHEHENSPVCYFNADELTKNVCPVCNRTGEFKFLTILKEAQAQNPNKQIVINGKIAYFTQKNCYDESIYGQNPNIKEEQKQLLQQRSKNNRKIIEHLNNIYNEEMLRIFIEKSPDELKKYTILAILNDKLILFYHQYRMKITLDIFLKQKGILQAITTVQGKIIQIIEFQNKLYFLHQISEKIQLFEGDLSSIISSYPISAKITLTQMLNFTHQSWAVLVKCSETKLIFIGSQGIIVVCDMEFRLPQMIQSQQIDIQKESTLISNTTTDLVTITGKNVSTYQLSSQLKNRSRYDTSFNSQPTILLRLSDNSFIAFDHEHLAQKNIFYLQLPNEHNTLPNLASIINHSTFAKLKQLTTTTYISRDISCILIGMQVNQFIVPAIMVFNKNTKTFEIEMI